MATTSFENNLRANNPWCSITKTVNEMHFAKCKRHSCSCYSLKLAYVNLDVKLTVFLSAIIDLITCNLHNMLKIDRWSVDWINAIAHLPIWTVGVYSSPHSSRSPCASWTTLHPICGGGQTLHCTFAQCVRELLGRRFLFKNLTIYTKNKLCFKNYATDLKSKPGRRISAYAQSLKNCDKKWKKRIC